MVRFQSSVSCSALSLALRRSISRDSSLTLSASSAVRSCTRRSRSVFRDFNACSAISLAVATLA
jgi:hypothetical protein